MDKGLNTRFTLRGWELVRHALDFDKAIRCSAAIRQRHSQPTCKVCCQVWLILVLLFQSCWCELRSAKELLHSVSKRSIDFEKGGGPHRCGSRLGRADNTLAEMRRRGIVLRKLPVATKPLNLNV